MSIQAPFLLPQPYSTRSRAPSRSLHQAECVWRYSPSHAVISELHNASHGVERQSEHYTTFLLFCNPNYSLTRTCTFDATHFPLCYHNTSPIISVYHRHQPPSSAVSCSKPIQLSSGAVLGLALSTVTSHPTASHMTSCSSLPSVYHSRTAISIIPFLFSTLLQMNKMSITVKWRNVKDGVGLSSKEGFDFLEDMIPAVLDKLPRILLQSTPL